jgi:hypothetical protein
VSCCAILGRRRVDAKVGHEQSTIRKGRGSSMSEKKEKDVVQIKNPKSGHYVKIDRAAGMILDHKKSEGPYKGVPIARKKK